MANRFAVLSVDDLNNLDFKKDSSSTKRVVSGSVKLFRQFLGEENAEFEKLPKKELNNKLRLFFASLRTERGEEFKKSSLHNIKYGLCKFLRDNCQVDITTDSEFESTMKTFKAKLTDLKKKGKGAVDHKKEIAPCDLKRLMDPENLAFNLGTPVGLQNKVWFDIMYHLCRRGQENLRQMDKSTFEVLTDSCGRQYVCQAVDEADKNHGADSCPDDTIGEARMYAQQGDRCPVKSFKAYCLKLHPECSSLWQRPLESFTPTNAVWYYNAALGKNSLGQMMTKISSLAGLSYRYTNHCIRATSISALDRAGFEARHIIRASGHKSETSIKSYSRRLTETTQQQMSDSLNNTLIGKPNNAKTANSELTAMDLEQIFSYQNDFTEIETVPVAVNTASVIDLPDCHDSSNSRFPTTNTMNYNIDHQTNVAHVIPGSTQIFNFPANSENNNGSYFNITPHMNHCNVNFHFHGK